MSDVLIDAPLLINEGMIQRLHISAIVITEKDYITVNLTFEMQMNTLIFYYCIHTINAYNIFTCYRIGRYDATVIFGRKCVL